jgi:hypothetical protein
LTIFLLWQCGHSMPFSLSLPLYFTSHVLSDQCPQQGYKVIVATTNVKHISRFVDARLWTDI